MRLRIRLKFIFYSGFSFFQISVSRPSQCSIIFCFKDWTTQFHNLFSNVSKNSTSLSRQATNQSQRLLIPFMVICFYGRHFAILYYFYAFIFDFSFSNKLPNILSTSPQYLNRFERHSREKMYGQGVFFLYRNKILLKYSTV